MVANDFQKHRSPCRAKQFNSNKLIEVAVTVKRTTDKARLVTDGIIETWIPESQIKDEELRADGITILHLPDWLATEKGFIK